MALVTQKDLEDPAKEHPAWHRAVLRDVAERLTPPSEFPCVFSQNAFRRKLTFFSFVERFDAEGAAASVSDLDAYVRDAETWDGQVNTARPLIVAFGPEAARFDRLEAYHRFGWKVLQHWHDADPAPWPAEVARDPHSPFWSMCFGGMQIFVNMSTPAHQARRSRNLGAHMLFIVNPRERFDRVAGDTPEGRKVRQHIRSRVETYDGKPHCLQLGSYQAGEIEWWQYGVIEENRDRLDRCPFETRSEKTFA